MTDLAKLAYRLDALNDAFPSSAIREAAAILRSAAAADLQGLMAMVDTLVKDEVRASDCKRDAEEDAEESRAKLETALRLALQNERQAAIAHARDVAVGVCEEQASVEGIAQRCADAIKEALK